MREKNPFKVGHYYNIKWSGLQAKGKCVSITSGKVYFRYVDPIWKIVHTDGSFLSIDYISEITSPTEITTLERHLSAEN